MLEGGCRERIGRERKRWPDEVPSESFSRPGWRKQHAVTIAGTFLEPLYALLALEALDFNPLPDTGLAGRLAYLTSTPRDRLSKLPNFCQ